MRGRWCTCIDFLAGGSRTLLDSGPRSNLPNSYRKEQREGHKSHHSHITPIRVLTGVHLGISVIGAVSMGTIFMSKGSSLGWLQYWRRALSNPTTDTFSAVREDQAHYSKSSYSN